MRFISVLLKRFGFVQQETLQKRDCSSQSYQIKMKFLLLLDGIYLEPPLFPGITSFELGICKLEYTKEKLHVYLRRPGLIIGRRGETINAIIKELGINIEIHEVMLEH